MKDQVLKSYQYPGFAIEVYDIYWKDYVEYVIHIPEFKYMDFPDDYSLVKWEVDEYSGMVKQQLVPRTVKSGKFKVGIKFDLLIKMTDEQIGNVIFEALPKDYHVVPVLKMIRTIWPEKPKEPTEDFLFSKFIVNTSEHAETELKKDYFEEKLKQATKLELNPNDPAILARNLPGVYHRVMHPLTDQSGRLMDVVIDLNDHFKWTREQIADWLEEISDPTGVNGPDIRFRSSND